MADRDDGVARAQEDGLALPLVLHAAHQAVAEGRAPARAINAPVTMCAWTTSGRTPAARRRTAAQTGHGSFRVLAYGHAEERFASETGWLNLSCTARELAGVMLDIIARPEQITDLNEWLLAHRDAVVKPMRAHAAEMDAVYAEITRR